MAQLHAKKASKMDYERTAKQATDPGLFSPGGPFEHYPGAVLVAGRNGIVLGANAVAKPIATLLRQQPPQALRDAIDSALNGKAAQINPLLMNPTTPLNYGIPVNPTGPSLGSRSLSDNGFEDSGQAFDLAVLPWGEGTAALLLARDITLERGLRAALIESRQRYKDLVEASCDFAWETDAQGCFVFVSPHGALGFSAAELIGVQAQEFLVASADRPESVFTTKQAAKDVNLWVRGMTGEECCLTATALPLTDPNGAWCGARGLCSDITTLQSTAVARADTHNQERLLAYILSSVRDQMDPAQMLKVAVETLVPALPVTGAAIYRYDGNAQFVCSAQTGNLPSNDLCTSLLDKIDAGDDEAEEIVEDGRLLVKATRHRIASNGALCLWRLGRGGNSNDWSAEERHLLEEVAEQIGLAIQKLTEKETLEKLSSTDSMTGLLNQHQFSKELQKRFTRAADRRRCGALFYIDMDNFKLVNDNHGHKRGDAALRAFARILRDLVRSRDLAARLGGDEFALFLEDVSAEVAAQKAEELMAVAQELAPFSGDPEFPLGLSIGVAAYDPAKPENLSSLMERADKAMYSVKQRGKSGFALAPPAGSKEV